MSGGENISVLAYYVVLAVLSATTLIFAAVLFVLCRRKTPAKAEEEDRVPTARVSAASYSLTEVDAATDGFNHRRIIGKGRIGTVYLAVMAKGELAAAKRIHPRLVLNNAGFRFSTVLKWLSLCDHPHLVPITGFSEAPGERIILMEFNGMLSLDFYLHQNPDGAALLDWSRRLRIAAGAARGLEYLHEVVAPPIIHGCVKPSNILVDVKFCARLSDYGLTFLAPHEKQGLVGYVDDSYGTSSEEKNGASKECDVFGFGVVLLELLSGRKSEGGLIVQWALPLIKELRLCEFLDPRLPIPTHVEPLVRLSKVALACVGNCRENRPPISQVASILSDLETSL
ncbi:kinase family protein [Striga asiatica]|uniref:Kinase family protein n=1 Tax=Striga asiatica TaxID=4170 RepID=A0A5A7Q8Q9_STRAF|nr:kinase family protein [Striga asiatica]